VIYGYAHASTDAEDLSNQMAWLKTAGCVAITRTLNVQSGDDFEACGMLIARNGNP
jgi:hypothetical protein